MGVANLTDIRSFNDHTRARLLKRIGSCPAEMTGWKPAPSKWSVAEHVEHLALAEQVFTQWITRLIAEGKAKGMTGRPNLVDAFPTLRPLGDRPLEAPASMIPQGRPLSESLGRLAASREEINALYDQLDGLDTDQLLIPFFQTVQLNAAQVMHLVGLHEYRHEQHLAGLIEAWEVEPGLYRILLPLPWNVPFVNAYLIESQGQWMLVDCGLNWGPSLRALGRALKAIGVPHTGLTYLVLTHRHPDHSGATGPVQGRWGGEVLLHPVDAARTWPSPGLVREWLMEHGLDDAALLERLSTPPRRPEEVLPAEISPMPERVALGDLTIETIQTPGHSWGHVMLREGSRGWLLSADQVLPTPATNIWAHPDDRGDPLGAYLTSLASVADLDYTLLLPGHGMPQRGGFREGCQAMAAHHRAFARRIYATLKGRRLTTWEITQQAYPRWMEEPGEVRFLLSEALAALRYLVQTGTVRRGADGRWGITDTKEAASGW